MDTCLSDDSTRGRATRVYFRSLKSRIGMCWEVMPGFQFRTVRRFFDKGAARDLDSDDWRKEIEWLVTKLDVRDRDSVNVTQDDIEIELKKGTRVSDSINGQDIRCS